MEFDKSTIPKLPSMYNKRALVVPQITYENKHNSSVIVADENAIAIDLAQAAKQ